MLTASGIDTLDPERAEVAFFLLPAFVCIAQRFLDSVFSYCPDIFTTAIITFGHL